MPDWTIHLGAASLLSRGLDRHRPWLILLGGVLPDFISRLNAVLGDALTLNWFYNYSLGCFHTPFMLILVSLWIAILIPAQTTGETGSNFAYIYVSSLLHIFIDMLEVKIPGFGEYLLFPLSAKTFQLNWLSTHSSWYFVFYAFMLVALVSWLRDLIKFRTVSLLPGWKVWLLHWRQQSRSRKIVWLFLTVSIAIMPFYAHDYFIRHNAGYIQFRYSPEDWEGKKVGLNVSKVVSPNILEEYPFQFKIATDQSITVGEWVSVYGTYRNQQIEVIELEREFGARYKICLSLVGLLLVILGLVWSHAIKKPRKISSHLTKK